MGCYKYGNWLETLMKHNKKYYNKGFIKKAALPPLLPICSSILSEYILWSFDKTNLSPLPASPFPARRTNCYLWLYYCSLCAKSLQLCPALCDPIAWIPSDSTVHGISQARTLEWVAISFSRGASPPGDWTPVSCIFCTGRQVLYH